MSSGGDKTQMQEWTGLRNCSEWLSFVMNDRNHQVLLLRRQTLIPRGIQDSILSEVPHIDPRGEWRVGGLAIS